jgi:type II secretory pathway component PulC
MRKLFWAGWVFVALPLFLPRSGLGQDSQDRPGGEMSDSILGYEREVFEYSAAGRRNPFRPLTVFNTGGPRFDDLELTGIVYSPEVGSVVVVADRTNERRYKLREGERVGTARVLEIRPDEVVFAITTLGGSRQAILRVKKERGQGE